MRIKSSGFVEIFSRRDSAVISLHTHNDRGTGVAATELGLGLKPSGSRVHCLVMVDPLVIVIWLLWP